MRFHSMVLLTPIIGLALTACGEQHKPAEKRPAVAVSVSTAALESVPSAVVAPGRLQSRNRIVIASQINGFAVSVRARAGDVVSAGQLIATLDSRDADSQKAASQAGIAEAEAALEEARNGEKAAASMRDASKASSDLAASTLARYQKLLESRSASPQELDEVRSRRDAAAADLLARETVLAGAKDRIRQIEAKIAGARAGGRRVDVLVSWTEIKAPAAGRIVERSVESGSAVFPGSPLFVLETLASPQVLADLPASLVKHLKLGIEVSVRISGAQEPVHGRISEIVPLSNASAHTVQFKVDLPAGVAALPGEYARVELRAGTRSALLVPTGAIRETGQITGVYVADASGKARMRLVKTTPHDASRTEILSGLEPGERYVNALTDAVVDSTPLEIRQ